MASKGSMTVKALKRLLIVLLFLTGGYDRASGQTLTTSNIVTFSETYIDKIDGEHYCEPMCDYTVGGFKVTATISLAGIDITQINTNTQFLIYLGQTYCTISNSLSDDPRYQVGKTVATFIQTTAYPQYNCVYDHTLLLYTAKLKWNTQYLTVTIHGKNNSGWYDQEYFLANNYDGDPTGPISTVTNGEIIFGGDDVDFRL
jgi:hypothetical protein